MRAFAKSAISFPWAIGVLGVQQLANTVTPQNPDRPDRVTTSLNAVTRATEMQFDKVIRLAFEAGDVLQKGVVDLTFNMLTLRSPNPSDVLRMTCGLIQESAGSLAQIAAKAGSPSDSASGGNLLSSLFGAMQSAMPSVARITSLFVPEEERGAARQVFDNTFEAFQLVPEVGGLRLPPPGVYPPLPELVAKAYELAPYPALWAVEGLGKYYADSFSQRNEVPRGALTDEKVKGLPDKSLTMLHAGLGLSFATLLLDTANAQDSGSDIRKTLEHFIALVEDNSRKGYVGCALESLGLVTRTFHPEMIPIVDQQLLEINPEVVSYFWHGVGRAVYFNLGLLLPGCGLPWRAIQVCWQEARHELGLLNAIAGVTWATTVVNMRTPQVMELLLKQHGDQISQDSAFANGVSSTLIMRYDTTPNDPNITRFCQYQPDASDPDLVELWNKEIRQPCEDALQKYYPVLKKHNLLEEVFHYQPLSELIDRLRSGRRG